MALSVVTASQPSSIALCIRGAADVTEQNRYAGPINEPSQVALIVPSQARIRLGAHGQQRHRTHTFQATGDHRVVIAGNFPLDSSLPSSRKLLNIARNTVAQAYEYLLDVAI